MEYFFSFCISKPRRKSWNQAFKSCVFDILTVIRNNRVLVGTRCNSKNCLSNNTTQTLIAKEIAFLKGNRKHFSNARIEIHKIKHAAFSSIILISCPAFVFYIHVLHFKVMLLQLVEKIVANEIFFSGKRALEFFSLLKVEKSIEVYKISKKSNRNVFLFKLNPVHL